MTGLPEGWAAAQLGDIVPKVTKGTTPTTNGFAFVDHGINFIKIENLDLGEIDTRSIRQFISHEAHISQDRSALAVDDILFSIAGTIGATAIVKASHLPANTNQALAILSGYTSAIAPKFLKLQLESFVARETISRARGGAMNNISLGDLKEANLVVPPLPEQHRIVAKIEELFSELDAGTASLTRARAQLKTYRQALLKAAFEGKLTAPWRAANPDKLESPETLLARIRKERDARYAAALDDWQTALSEWRAGGEVGDRPRKPSGPRDQKEYESLETIQAMLPDGWACARLGGILDVVSGGTPQGIETATGKDLPFYKVSDMNADGNERWMTRSKITLSKGERESLGLTSYPRGTIIFPKRGGAILTNKKRQLALESCFDLNTMGVLSGIASLSDEYLWYWFLALDLSKIYDGSNVPQINNKNVEPLAFPVCSRLEQDEVTRVLATKLSQVDAMDSEITTALTRITALRQSILKKAFSGQLVAQDPADEPASALLARLAQAPAPKPRRKTAK